MKKVMILLMVTMMTMMLASCSKGGDTTEIPYEAPAFETYINPIEIEGQWGANNATGPSGQYGIGDPFVMRYNGKYYLYPSTSDGQPGIKVFESDDMVNWTYRGYAVAETEETARGAYAPEVIYYRGYFYMCQSRAGKGHYVYRSESPTEGFTLFSKSESGADAESVDYGNLGMGIDGSFYVTDDGRLLLLHTSTPAGLKYNEILDIDTISPATLSGTRSVEDANLNHWIEGPGVFRRGDISYLTYTGNHVLSKGYRVAYSYAKDLTDLAGFTQPQDNVTLIDTADEHYGLGHSSNFNGPDLDSVYTAYHSLVGSGPARRYNLDRYLASGSILTANGVTHRAVAMPELPAASAAQGAELVNASEAYLLNRDAQGYFTAEYNLIPQTGQELYFGVTNAGRYVMAFTAEGLRLTYRTGTEERVIASGEATYNADKLNTVRVENGNGTGYVYLNSMRILQYDAKAAAGGIGYRSAFGVGYTAFSNDVFGTSDFEAIKNLPTKFPATSYLKGEGRGFRMQNAAVTSGGVRVGEKESTRKVDNAYAVVLKAGDWVKYAVDAEKADTYQLASTVTRASAGAKLKITLGNSTVECTVPQTGTGSDTVKVSLGRIAATQGVQTLKIQVLAGTAEFITIETYDNAEAAAYGGAEEFDTLNGTVSVQNGTLTADGTNGTALAVWGNSGVADFEVSMKIRVKFGAAADCGIVFRTKHYSSFKDQPSQSFMGYYLNLGEYMMVLNRYDYGSQTLAARNLRDSSGNGVFADGGEHLVVIRAESNRFTITVDGAYVLKASDDTAFFDGRIGLYAKSAVLSMTDLKYTAL